MAFTQASKFAEWVIERNQVHILSRKQSNGLNQSQGVSLVPFCRMPISGEIVQNLRHDLRRDGHEVGAILRLVRFLADETQVCFVHQRRALQGVVGRF